MYYCFDFYGNICRLHLSGVKNTIKVILIILAALFCLLVVAVEDDIRWFHQFSKNKDGISTDSFSVSRSQNTDYSLRLTDVFNSDCFWDETEQNGVNGGLNSCYRFLPNGKCFEYSYYFYDKKITDSVYHTDNDDLILPDKWSAIGDTLLIARGTHFKVLEYTQHSVTVLGYMNDTMVFRKNCNTVLHSSK